MKQQGALDKAFLILQLLAEEPQQGIALGDLASRLSLNKATCSHILKKLGELHYVEQIAPRKGYRLGPMAYYLTRKGPYRRDLVSVAEPVMGRLAKSVEETVILVTLSHGTRLTLCGIEGGGEVRVNESVMMDANAYGTATGRVLLAHAPRHELETFVSTNGLPGDRWPEARNWSLLIDALAEVRRCEGCYEVTLKEIAGIGCPVRDGKQVVAALGLYLPLYRYKGRHKQEILSRMPKTAEEIGTTLSRRFAAAKR